MNNAVTIIVGAGAVMDFEHKGITPSVKNITEEVLKQSIQKVNGGERLLLRDINDHVVKQLNQVGRPEIIRLLARIEWQGNRIRQTRLKKNTYSLISYQVQGKQRR